MDFANEHYVRIYTRDTTTWKRLRWHGQNVLTQLLRKMDAAGVLDIEDMEPWEAVVLHCGAPEADAREGMTRCLELGVFIHNGRYLVAPKYREANEANKSDRQRQSELRARRRAQAMETDASVTKRDIDEQVTKRDADVTRSHACSSQDVTAPSRSVTEHHTLSQAVTLTNSVTVTDAVAVTDSATDPPNEPPPLNGSSKVTPELVSREWHRIGQPVWNGRGVLTQPTSHHRESYEVIAASCNATAAPTASLAALLEYFWTAPHGPIASRRITRPKPSVLAEGVTDDLAEALAWKRGETSPRAAESDDEDDEPDMYKPYPPMPAIPVRAAKESS